MKSIKYKKTDIHNIYKSQLLETLIPKRLDQELNC